MNAFQGFYPLVTVVNVTQSQLHIVLCISEFYIFLRHDRLSFVVKLNSHPVSERVLQSSGDLAGLKSVFRLEG